MKELKIRLTDKNYEMLKKIDFSEIKDEVNFDDDLNEFSTKSRIVGIIFTEYIAVHGFDENYNLTEYGKKLYDLYDLIFFSEEV
jgi:hypothetical protein